MTAQAFADSGLGKEHLSAGAAVIMLAVFEVSLLIYMNKDYLHTYIYNMMYTFWSTLICWVYYTIHIIAAHVNLDQLPRFYIYNITPLLTSIL